MLRSGVAQIYGYSVCFLSTLSALAVLLFIANRLDRWREPQFSTFLATDTGATSTAEVADQSTLLRVREAEYEAARRSLNDRIQYLELATFLAFFATCFAVFVFHWRWLHRPQPASSS